MLCQNCKRNDAGVHIKRIVGGESAEIHLCSACAAALGVRDAVTGFSPFGDMLSALSGARTASRALRCETCGFSFEDIARTGLPGCPDCYRTFSQKLRPTLVKLHGRAVYKGKIPEKAAAADNNEAEIVQLKAELEKAIGLEDFETAAVIRDRIRALVKKEEN